MPQIPTMSACGFAGTVSMFSSTISTSQLSGHKAASVASPSGALTARFPVNTFSTAHWKLQKLSGNIGLISKSLMGRLDGFR